MNSIALSLITERFLIAALESSMLNRTMQTEGRTEPTPAEKAKLRRATDDAAAAASAAVSQL